MIKLFKIFAISIVIFVNSSNQSKAIPVAPFKKFFQELFEVFATKSDDVIKKGNKTDEMISGSNARNMDDATIAARDQDLIINKVSNENHTNYYNDTINQSPEIIASKHGVTSVKIGKKVSGESDKLVDIFDFAFDESDENIKMSNYILKSWIGRIYNSSKFKKKVNEERLLLVCKNSVEVFYFTIIMNNQNDINRVYLTDHKYFQSSIKTLKKQELLVLLDDNDVKIMSTKPKSKNTFPSNYFTIYSDQYFMHSKYLKPEKIIENAKYPRSNRPINNKCYKATKDGLLKI